MTARPPPDRGGTAGPVPRSRVRGVAWTAIVAVGAALPLACVLLAGRSLVWGDTAVLFGPVRPLVVEALRELRVPLWNPYEAMGIPLHAQLIHAALHPVSVAAALLAPRAPMDAFVVVNVVVAALGAGVLARALGCSRAAAAAAALGYGLSGYVLGMGAVLQYQTAAATAPWAVAALRLAGDRAAGLAVAAAGVACLHLAGDPQWTIVAVLLGIALAADAGRGRGAARAVAGVALGTLVGAVQLAPAWAFLAHTERSAGVSAADRLQWALSPWRILELAAPGFFAGRASEHLRAPVFLWLGGETQSRLLRPFVPSVFVGAPVLALAALGLRAGRAARILAVAAALALWLALGYHAGAEQLLHAVPVWGSFRYSEKLVGPLTLCLAVLAGLGADRLRDRPTGKAVTALAIASAAAGLLLRLTPTLDAALATASAPASTVALARRALGAGLLHAAGGLALVAAVSSLARRSLAARRRAAAGAAAVVLAAGILASPFALHAGARDVADGALLASLRSGEPVMRIATPVADPPYPDPLGLGPADADVAARSRMGVTPFTVPLRIDQVDVYSGLTPRRTIRFAERMAGDAWTSLRRFGLTHVVVGRPAGERSAAIARSAIEGGVLVASSAPWQFSVWRVPHRPWARFARRVIPVDSEDRALETLAAYELAGMDATVVEGGEVLPTSAGTVLSIGRGRESLRIEAEASGPAFLVVSDSFWPGWRATIDGAPVGIYRTDYLVRGVPFPAGRHVLEMRYAPREATIGYALAALGVVVTVAAAAATRRRGRAADA